MYHRLRVSPESDPPPTSLLLDGIVLSHKHRRVAARIREEVVIYDYRAAKKTETPGFMRGALGETWRLQEQEIVRARTRIWELIGIVERLERKTWDREDAMEDLGAGASKQEAKCVDGA